MRDCEENSLRTWIPARPGQGRDLPFRGRRLLSRRHREAQIREGWQMAWTRAAALEELKERHVMDALIGDEEIALYWVDDAAYATDNICTHAFARLSDGYLDGDCIECPIHQALFDVKRSEE